MDSVLIFGKEMEKDVFENVSVDESTSRGVECQGNGRQTSHSFRKDKSS